MKYKRVARKRLVASPAELDKLQKRFTSYMKNLYKTKPVDDTTIKKEVNRFLGEASIETFGTQVITHVINFFKDSCEKLYVLKN